jgi:hypothetical protein
MHNFQRVEVDDLADYVLFLNLTYSILFVE